MKYKGSIVRLLKDTPAIPQQTACVVVNQNILGDRVQLLLATAILPVGGLDPVQYCMVRDTDVTVLVEDAAQDDEYGHNFTVREDRVGKIIARYSLYL